MNYIICILRSYYLPPHHHIPTMLPLANCLSEENRKVMNMMHSSTIPSFDSQEQAIEWYKAFVQNYRKTVSEYNEKIKGKLLKYPLSEDLPDEIYITQKASICL